MQQVYDDAGVVVTGLASVGIGAATGGTGGAAGAAPGAVGAVATLIGHEVIRDRYQPRIESMRTTRRELRSQIGQHRTQAAEDAVLAKVEAAGAARHEANASTEAVQEAIIEYQRAYRELAIASRQMRIQTPTAMLDAERELVFQADACTEYIVRLRNIRRTSPVATINSAIVTLQSWKSMAIANQNSGVETACDHNITVLRLVNSFYDDRWNLWRPRLEWLRRREYLTTIREARSRMVGALSSTETAQGAR